MERALTRMERAELPEARRVRAALRPWLPQPDVAELLHRTRSQVDKAELSALAKVGRALRRERAESV